MGSGAGVGSGRIRPSVRHIMIILASPIRDLPFYLGGKLTFGHDFGLFVKLMLSPRQEASFVCAFFGLWLDRVEPFLFKWRAFESVQDDPNPWDEVCIPKSTAYHDDPNPCDEVCTP